MLGERAHEWGGYALALSTLTVTGNSTLSKFWLVGEAEADWRMHMFHAQ